MKSLATFARTRFAAGLLALVCLLAPCVENVRAVAPASPAPADSPDAEEQRVAALLKSFHPQKGKVTLKDGVADLDLPDQFRYLDATDSRKLLVDIWGNPPEVASDVIGMVIPTGFGQDEEHSWGATISFNESGYIKDEEPDYNDLLKKIKDAQEQNNPEREKAGYRPLHILGWAQPPHYDKDAKKLYWAKELQSGDNAQHGLNYDIRILGRRGALEFSIIAAMEQLGQINNVVPSLLATVNFKEGHRYADFNPKTDKVAAFGLAGLIGGGLLLAKVGGLKWLFALLLAAKKFVIVGVVAVGVGVVMESAVVDVPGVVTVAIPDACRALMPEAACTVGAELPS